MMPPGYVPMPGPGVVSQPVVLPPSAPPQRLAQTAPTANQGLPKPIARGLPAEIPAPARREPLSMPAPEKLGVALAGRSDPAPRPAEPAVDWNAARARMEAMGYRAFQIERPAEGGWRTTITLPTAESGRTYRLDGAGATEAEAVRVCLDKAERWFKQIP